MIVRSVPPKDSPLSCTNGLPVLGRYTPNGCSVADPRRTADATGTDPESARAADTVDGRMKLRGEAEVESTAVVTGAVLGALMQYLRGRGRGRGRSSAA